MFGFKKSKEQNELYAPINGKLIGMEDVADPVFSQKMLGDGFAVVSNGDTICAPADARISMIFPSKHVVGLTFTDGMEIIIHIGINTVNEEGKGFEAFCKQGQKVKRGDPLIRIDRVYLEDKGYDLSIIVVFTNKNTYKEVVFENVKEVIAGESIVATYTV
ncbi:MAG: PTS glucose transporter subunit IIA [Anaerostipes sp.]|nr:PTS glucose transporter subunit IIA [Anaerostipes sp.]